MLPETVLLVTANVPLLLMAPPSRSCALPLAIVRSFKVSVAPEFTTNTWNALPPSTVMFSPLPSIVGVFWIAGSVLPIVIVPLTLKLIVSVPVPTTQSPPVVSLLGLLVLLIASRRLHEPSPEVLESLSVLTVIVLPPACSSDWITMTHKGASTTSRIISSPGRTTALETLVIKATAVLRI